MIRFCFRLILASTLFFAMPAQLQPCDNILTFFGLESRSISGLLIKVCAHLNKKSLPVKPTTSQKKILAQLNTLEKSIQALATAIAKFEPNDIKSADFDIIAFIRTLSQKKGIVRSLQSILSSLEKILVDEEASGTLTQIPFFYKRLVFGLTGVGHIALCCPHVQDLVTEEECSSCKEAQNTAYLHFCNLCTTYEQTFLETYVCAGLKATGKSHQLNMTSTSAFIEALLAHHTKKPKIYLFNGEEIYLHPYDGPSRCSDNKPLHAGIISLRWNTLDGSASELVTCILKDATLTQRDLENWKKFVFHMQESHLQKNDLEWMRNSCKAYTALYTQKEIFPSSDHINLRRPDNDPVQIDAHFYTKDQPIQYFVWDGSVWQSVVPPSNAGFVAPWSARPL